MIEDRGPPPSFSLLFCSDNRSMLQLKSAFGGKIAGVHTDHDLNSGSA
jgi:hypothetical protein